MRTTSRRARRTTLSKTRREIAQDFFTVLFEPLQQDSVIEVRLKRNDEDKARSQFFKAITDINVESFGFDEHVWFGVALRRATSTSGKRDDLTWVTAVWADIDYYKDGVSSRDQVLTKLSRFTHPPTMIVDSGGGFHAYWKLKRPLDLSQESQALYVREVVYGLAHKLGGDLTVHDLTRVLRVPGTFNAGNGKTKTYSPPRESQIVHVDPKLDYAVEDLSSHRKPIPVPAQAQKVVVPKATNPAPGADQLKITDRLKQLVVKGWSRGCGYPSRSELDQAVMIAMLRGGHTVEEITAVWRDPSYKIGDKYREKGADGDRYLATTLGSAQEWVKSTAAGAPDVREKDGRIEIRGEKEWRMVLDRPIVALAKLTGEERGFQVKIGAERRTLTGSDFASNIAFKKALNLAGSWLGDDRDVQRLIAYLESQAPPTKRVVTTIGWHGDDVVFPNGQLRADGTLLLDDATDYVYKGKLTDVQLLPCEDWDKLATEVLTHLPKLNRSVGLVPVIGWFMATFVAPQVRRLSRSHAFPLLMLYGSKGTGKSTTLEVLQSLCGGSTKLRKLTEITKASALIDFSATNSFPIIIDEHRRNDQTKVPTVSRYSLYPSFRNAYDGAVGERGTADLDVRRFNMVAPVAIAGETPFRDAALVDRTVHVKFDPLLYDQAALDRLLALPLGEFTAGFYRHVRTKDLKALFEEADKLLPAAVQGASTRQRHAWSVVALGLLLLEPFWPRQLIESLISQFDTYKSDTSEEVLVSGKGLVYEAIRVISELARARRIRDGADYVIREVNSEHLLWFVPAIVLPAIEEYFQKFPSDLPMTREAILQALREESKATDPLVARYQDTFKSGGKTVRGIALHLENVEKEMSIPVDYWLQGAVIGAESF